MALQALAVSVLPPTCSSFALGWLVNECPGKEIRERLSVVTQGLQWPCWVKVLLQHRLRGPVGQWRAQLPNTGTACAPSFTSPSGRQQGTLKSALGEKSRLCSNKNSVKFKLNPALVLSPFVGQGKRKDDIKFSLSQGRMSFWPLVLPCGHPGQDIAFLHPADMLAPVNIAGLVAVTNYNTAKCSSCSVFFDDKLMTFLQKVPFKGIFSWDCTINYNLEIWLRMLECLWCQTSDVSVLTPMPLTSLHLTSAGSARIFGYDVWWRHLLV